MVYQITYKKKVYTGLKLIGSGAYAEVYTTNSKKYALKVLWYKTHLEDPDGCSLNKSLLIEMTIMKFLRQSSYNMYFYSWKITKNKIILLLPFVRHATKHEYSTSFTPEMKVITIRRLIHAVAELHAYSIAHRDIKMDNFIVASDPNESRLVDYNHSRIFLGNNDYYLDDANYSICTRHMRAPELIDKKKVSAERVFSSDIYSLGIMIIALCCKNINTLVNVFREHGFKPLGINNGIHKGIIDDCEPALKELVLEINDRVIMIAPSKRTTLQELAELVATMTKTEPFPAEIFKKKVIPAPMNEIYSPCEKEKLALINLSDANFNNDEILASIIGHEHPLNYMFLTVDTTEIKKVFSVFAKTLESTPKRKQFGKFINETCLSSFAIDYASYELEAAGIKLNKELLLEQIYAFKCDVRYNLPESICAYTILASQYPDQTWPQTEFGKNEVSRFVALLEEHYSVSIKNNENIIMPTLCAIINGVCHY
jgi:serine/threonine protein kinase